MVELQATTSYYFDKTMFICNYLILKKRRIFFVFFDQGIPLYLISVFALTASIASVVWGSSTYIYSIILLSNETFQWKSLLLKLIWHFGMLIGRIAGILLFSIVFGIWTLLPLGEFLWKLIILRFILINII